MLVFIQMTVNRSSEHRVPVCVQITVQVQLDIQFVYLLTEFVQFAEVDLLPLVVLQVGVKCGAHQSKPADLRCL